MSRSLIPRTEQKRINPSDAGYGVSSALKLSRKPQLSLRRINGLLLGQALAEGGSLILLQQQAKCFVEEIGRLRKSGKFSRKGVSPWRAHVASRVSFAWSSSGVLGGERRYVPVRTKRTLVA